MPAILWNGRQGELRGGSLNPLDCKGKRVMFMTSYETIMVIVSFVNCLLIVLVAWISSLKK